MKTSFAKGAQNFLSGLGAGSARRGKTVLQLVHARVADCVTARLDNPTSLYRGEAQRDTRNLAYLGAVASGARNAEAQSCTIQDLERYAADWADLVPHSPAIQADLAKRFSDLYSFEAHQVPGIIAALGLDDTSTAEEFRVQTGKELNSIYANSTPIAEAFRWRRARAGSWIENLPAFWASFALTITSTLGPSVLALPIVFLSFGPVAASLMILGIGALNTLTLAYLAESQLRGGPLLRRSGFNHIIEHYLGPTALNLLKFCLFLYCVVVLFAFTGGFLEAITSTVGTGGIVWFIALYLFVFWYLSPRNHTGSLVSAFVIAVINLTIIAGFTALILFVQMTDPTALPNAGVPPEQGNSTIPIQIAVGAALYSFAGHVSVSNSAQLVLRRRNSEKGFLRGAVVGLGTISVLYAIWAFATINAIDLGILPHSTSVLQSISQSFGPAASVFSVVFIVLSLGIGSGNYAMAAHHVLVDTFTRCRQRNIGARPSDRPASGTCSVWSLEQLSGLAVITMIMAAALFAYLQGVVDLNQFFGLIGGLMAPIIAGVFPVLIFVACRQRGVFVESRVIDVLSGKPIVLLLLAGIASVYVWQGSTGYYALWYRCLSVGLCLLFGLLVFDLYRKGAFRIGAVISIEKSKDGWDPKIWKVFEQGREIDDVSLTWKAARSDDFHAVSKSTNPVRTLSSVRVDKDQLTADRFDVSVIDRNSGSSVEFSVDESNPAFLEIAIRNG